MNIAIILAAGTGKRMGGDRPKQFLHVNGEPVLTKTLKAFGSHPDIDAIIVAAPPSFIAETEFLVSELHLTVPVRVIAGGSDRRESSYLAVSEAGKICGDNDILLIHDGARPFVTAEIIDENIKKASENGACETAFPSTDTVAVSSDGNFIDSVPERRTLWNVQTPQSFRYGIISAAHRHYIGLLNEGTAPAVTDDAGLVMLSGLSRVSIAMGSCENIKITFPKDLRFNGQNV